MVQSRVFFHGIILQQEGYLMAMTNGIIFKRKRFFQVLSRSQRRPLLTCREKSPSWTPKAKQSPDLKQLEGISFSSVSGAGPEPGSAAWRWENHRQLQSQPQTSTAIAPEMPHSCFMEHGENSVLLQPGVMAFAVQNQGTTGLSMGGEQNLLA